MSRARDQDVLKVGVLTPVRQPELCYTPDATSVLVFQQIYDTPFRFAEGSGERPIPLLFESFETRGSGRRFVAKLRRDLHLSDGSPLTPDAVARSLNDSVLRHVARVQCKRDELIFEVQRNGIQLESLLCNPSYAIMIERDGRWLGTGPYALAERTDDFVRLVRNPHFQPPARIAEIHVRVYPPDKQGRATALEQALSAGEIDLSTDLPRESVDRVRGVRKVFRAGEATAFLFFNCERAPMSNVAVRHAVATGIDREELAAACYSNPLAYTAKGMLPPILGRLRDNHRYSAARARQLLREAGVAQGTRLAIIQVWGPREYLPKPRKTTGQIVEQLRALGFEPSIIETRDGVDFFETTSRGEYDLLVGGWIADSIEAVDYCESLLDSRRFLRTDQPNVHAGNMARWRDADTDALIARYRETGDESVLKAIGDLVDAQRPFLPLMYGPSVVVHSWRVSGVEWTGPVVPSFAKLELT